MKKKTLLNAIIISLSIIAGVSIIIAAFMKGTINGFIAISCVLTMVIIYHGQHDLTAEDIQTSYNQGVEDGKTSEHHDYPSNEEVENWFSKTEKVIVGTNGEDSAVHIIDGQGEEWVLYVDETINK